jgi:hypothetical protein
VKKKPEMTRLSIGIATATKKERKEIGEIFGRCIGDVLLLLERRKPGTARRALKLLKRQKGSLDLELSE